MKIVLNEAFKMLDFEEVWIIVDFKVIKNRNKCTLMLNQTLYVKKVLIEKKMKDCLHIEILMKLKLFITLNEINNVMKVSTINMQQIEWKVNVHCM